MLLWIIQISRRQGNINRMEFLPTWTCTPPIYSSSKYISHLAKWWTMNYQFCIARLHTLSNQSLQQYSECLHIIYIWSSIHWLSSLLLPSYINFHNHAGDCVDAYARRFKISQVAASFQRIVPRSSTDDDNNSFCFQNDNDVRAMFNSGLPRRILEHNCYAWNHGEQSYYKWPLLEFPNRATVRCWRGEVKKASILVQPLSSMDKTTNKGAGVVLISQLDSWQVTRELMEIQMISSSKRDGIRGQWCLLEMDWQWQEWKVLANCSISIVWYTRLGDMKKLWCSGRRCAEL